MKTINLLTLEAVAGSASCLSFRLQPFGIASAAFLAVMVVLAAVLLFKK